MTYVVTDENYEYYYLDNLSVLKLGMLLYNHKKKYFCFLVGYMDNKGSMPCLVYTKSGDIYNHYYYYLRLKQEFIGVKKKVLDKNES